MGGTTATNNNNTLVSLPPYIYLHKAPAIVQSTINNIKILYHTTTRGINDINNSLPSLCTNDSRRDSIIINQSTIIIKKRFISLAFEDFIVPFLP